MTNIDKVYAIGDVIKKDYYQLSTAASAAIIAGKPEYREPLRLFAGHFGNAFQIIDDILRLYL